VEHFRQAEAAHLTITLSNVQHVVTKEFGESVWRDLLAYVKSLPDEAQLRPTDPDVSNAFSEGLESAEKRDYQTAVERFRRALRERPRKIRAHYYLGRALFRLQRYREALIAFEELLKFDPENLLAHYEIGKLRLYAQNYSQELLSKFDPENLLANYEIGNRYLSPQNYADAIAKYQWLKSQSENSMGDLDDSTFTAEGFIAGIRAARGLPDGLTWRAIQAMRMVRFTPASLKGAPVRTREFIEFNFNLH
jgi:tetratricopeptide (TPR) repeat protein